MKKLNIDKSWTLFLDRDGVINKLLSGRYVTNINEFEWCNGALEAISIFSQLFNRIIVVTNQQGIGKGIMSHLDLMKIHNYMYQEIMKNSGRIDEILYCSDLKEKENNCRKPSTQMPLQAKVLFPDIEFEKSIICGDSPSDLEMGKRLNMVQVLIKSQNSEINRDVLEHNYTNLLEFAYYLQKV